MSLKTFKIFKSFGTDEFLKPYYTSKITTEAEKITNNFISSKPNLKSLENLILLIIALSIGITALLPDDLFSKNQTTAEFIMIAFFMVKWIGGMAIFYGFKKGKNFNSAIWNSKYYNA